MIKFLIGILIGIFLIPLIKETQHWLCFYKFKGILREPIEFIKDVFHRVFVGEC